MRSPLLTQHQCGEGACRPSGKRTEFAKPESPTVRQKSHVAASIGPTCIQSAQGLLSVMRLETPRPKLQPVHSTEAEAVTRVGTRFVFSLATSIWLLLATVLSAQQVSHDSNLGSDCNQVESGGSSSSSSCPDSHQGSATSTSNAPTSPVADSGTAQPPSNNKNSDRQPTRGASRNRRANSLDRDISVSIRLKGRVVPTSGEALYEPARIVLSCGGQTIPQMHTDTNGWFNFQPRSLTPLALSDSSVRNFSGSSGFSQPFTTTIGRVRFQSCEAAHGGCWAPDLTSFLSARSLMGCDLYAELPGFRSSRVRLGTVRPSTRVNVGQITLYPLDSSSSGPVGVTTLASSPRALKSYRNGLRALQEPQPNFRKAAKFLERTVEIHPGDAQAWAALGQARDALEDPDGAQEAFARAIEFAPYWLQPYDAMIQIAANRRDWEKLDSLTATYLKLAPESAQVRFYSAVAAWGLHDSARTESILRQMQEFGEMDEWPMSYALMAEMHELRADFETAADYYEKYIEISVDAERTKTARKAIYDWGQLRVIEPRLATPTDDPRAE